MSKYVARWGILAAALVAFVLGLLDNGMDAIIANAIAICTGCIGLG